MSREEAEFEAKFAAAESDMRSSASMVGVLAEHQDAQTVGGGRYCICGSWEGPWTGTAFAAHQAEQLATAGFGDLQEARTEGVAIVANAVRGPLISIVQALEFPASWAATERASGG